MYVCSTALKKGLIAQSVLVVQGKLFVQSPLRVKSALLGQSQLLVQSAHMICFKEFVFCTYVMSREYAIVGIKWKGL